MESGDMNFNEFAAYYTITALSAKHRNQVKDRHELISSVVQCRQRVKRKQKQEASKQLELELATSEKVEDLVDRTINKKIGPQLKRISSAIHAIQKGTSNKKESKRKSNENAKNSSRSGEGVTTGSKKSYADSVRSPRQVSDEDWPSAKRKKQGNDRSKSKNTSKERWTTSRIRGSR
jgi:hypothetical protein